MSALHHKFGRFERHAQCDMEIRRRGPHTGLYCGVHNQWITWLNDHEVGVLIEDHSIPFHDLTECTRPLAELVAKNQDLITDGK